MYNESTLDIHLFQNKNLYMYFKVISVLRNTIAEN